MTFLFTTTEQDAVFPPSVVLTVIVALPSDLAMTTPEEDTSATDGALDDHVTDLSVALDGVTVAVNVWVSPSVIVKVVLLRLTPVTGMTFALTVTAQDAVLPPSIVLTVIVALPADLAMTTPVEDTSTTEELLDDHVTDLSVASFGDTVAVRVWVSPSVIVKLVSSRLTPVTVIILA